MNDSVVLAGSDDLGEGYERFKNISHAKLVLVWRDGQDIEPRALADACCAISCGARYAVGSPGRLWFSPNMWDDLFGVFLMQASMLIRGIDSPESALSVVAKSCIHNPKWNPIGIWDPAGLLAAWRASESPIEERLALHLFNLPRAEVGQATIVAQRPVTTDSGDYRLDFAFECDGKRVAVECDGHEFHERTKEQAARDKARDRSLVAAGWQVLRFTGSEIWADPGKCASEVGAVIGLGRADKQ